MNWFEEQARDWHAGVRQAKRLLAVATAEQVERLWNRARVEITRGDDAYGQGYVGCLASALDEMG